MRYAILFLLLFAASVRADSIAIGTLNGDGYTYQGNGLWQWTDGSIWQRSYVQPYYYGGYYYQGYYKYSYYGAGAYPKPTAQSGAQIIAKAVAARDAVRSEIIGRANDYQSLIEAIKAAKLDQDLGPLPALQGYGNQQYGQHGYNSALYGTFGVNTSTVYGYAPSLSQTIDPFRLNLDQHFLSAFQLAQGAQDSARTANTEFNASLTNAANQSAGLSGLTGRVAALERLSKLVEGPPLSTNTQMLFKLDGSGKVSPVEVLPAPKQFSPDGSLQSRWNLSAQKCATCHSGAKIEGGFDLAKFGTMAPAEIDTVLDRIELPVSDAKHMPPKVELTADEKIAWHQAAREARKQAANRRK